MHIIIVWILKTKFKPLRDNKKYIKVILLWKIAGSLENVANNVIFLLILIQDNF